MCDVSIVIVAWNVQQYVVDCLRSIERECTMPGIEVLVVDNGSSDGTAEAVEREFPNVRLIRSKTNLGFTKGNNLAIRQSHGRYVCLVNSDVLVLPNCFEELVAFMDARPEVGMVGPRVLNGDRSLQRSCYPFQSYRGEFLQTLGMDPLFPRASSSPNNNVDDGPESEPRPVQVLKGCFVMVRREAMDDVGLMDESLFFYGDDFDWCKRFWAKGWKVMYYPHAETIHYHAGSTERAPINFFIELQKAKLQYWGKHHGRIGRAYCVLLILLRELLRIGPRFVLYVVRPAQRDENGYKMRRSIACIRWLLNIGTVEDVETGLN